MRLFRLRDAVTLQADGGWRGVRPDRLKELYSDLLEGDYDCVDRFVLNAYSPFGVRPGGFRPGGASCMVPMKDWITSI